MSQFSLVTKTFLAKHCCIDRIHAASDWNNIAKTDFIRAMFDLDKEWTEVIKEDSPRERCEWLSDRIAEMKHDNKCPTIPRGVLPLSMHNRFIVQWYKHLRNKEINAMVDNLEEEVALGKVRELNLEVSLDEQIAANVKDRDIDSRKRKLKTVEEGDKNAYYHKKIGSVNDAFDKLSTKFQDMRADRDRTIIKNNKLHKEILDAETTSTEILRGIERVAELHFQQRESLSNLGGIVANLPIGIYAQCLEMRNGYAEIPPHLLLWMRGMRDLCDEITDNDGTSVLNQCLQRMEAPIVDYDSDTTTVAADSL